jgi:tripartite-type tricarboxylate transporter receptor subunit TctC
MMRAFVVALACAASAGVHAQAYPSKPVRFVVPWPPGGIVEIIGRPVVERIAQNWGSPIVLEAKPGANGSIGTEQVAKSAPDGYTWLLATLNHTVNPSLSKNLPWHPTNDFAGVSMIASVVALVKSQPGKLNYLMPGTGTSMHLNTELLKVTAGLDLVPVPYKGLPTGIPDLLAGSLAFSMVSIPLAAPHIASGKLKALAIGATKRSAKFPDVPTFVEAGFAEAQVVAWYAFLVPAKTPRDVVERISQETQKALADPEVQKRLEAAGADVAGRSTPAEVDAFLKSETARWAKLVRDAKIEAQ